MEKGADFSVFFVENVYFNMIFYQKSIMHA